MADDNWDGSDRRKSVDRHIVDLKDEVRKDFVSLESRINEMEDRFNERLREHEKCERDEFARANERFVQFNERFIEHLARYTKYEDMVEAITAERRAREQFWLSIQGSVMAGGILALVGACGSAIWFLVSDFLKGHK